MDRSAELATINTTLKHIGDVLEELKDEHKQTQQAVVELKVNLASFKTGSDERSKVGDWVVSAIISAMTAAGVTGVAKALIGSGQGHK